MPRRQRLVAPCQEIIFVRVFARLNAINIATHVMSQHDRNNIASSLTFALVHLDLRPVGTIADWDERGLRCGSNCAGSIETIASERREDRDDKPRHDARGFSLRELNSKLGRECLLSGVERT
jgi:hypothetical protein